MFGDSVWKFSAKLGHTEVSVSLSQSSDENSNKVSIKSPVTDFKNSVLFGFRLEISLVILFENLVWKFRFEISFGNFAWISRLKISFGRPTDGQSDF